MTLLRNCGQAVDCDDVPWIIKKSIESSKCAWRYLIKLVPAGIPTDDVERVPHQHVEPPMIAPPPRALQRP